MSLSWPSIKRLPGALADYDYTSKLPLTASVKIDGTNVSVGNDGLIRGRRTPITRDTYQKIPLTEVFKVKDNLEEIEKRLQREFIFTDFRVFGELVVQPKHGWTPGKYFVFGITFCGTPRSNSAFNVCQSPEREKSGTYVVTVNGALENLLSGLVTTVPSREYNNIGGFIQQNIDIFDREEGAVITFHGSKRSKEDIVAERDPSRGFYTVCKFTQHGKHKDVALLGGCPQTSTVKIIKRLLNVSRDIAYEARSAETKFDEPSIDDLIIEIGSARV